MSVYFVIDLPNSVFDFRVNLNRRVAKVGLEDAIRAGEDTTFDNIDGLVPTADVMFRPRAASYYAAFSCGLGRC